MGDAGIAEFFKEMFAGAGFKDPERFLPHAPELEDGEVEKVSVEKLQALEKELNAALQEMQGALSDSQSENFKLSEQIERMKTDENVLAEDNKLLEEQIQTIERGIEEQLGLMRKEKAIQAKIHELEVLQVKMGVKEKIDDLDKERVMEKAKEAESKNSAEGKESLKQLKDELAEIKKEIAKQQPNKEET